MIKNRIRNLYSYTKNNTDKIRFSKDIEHHNTRIKAIRSLASFLKRIESQSWSMRIDVCTSKYATYVMIYTQFCLFPFSLLRLLLPLPLRLHLGMVLHPLLLLLLLHLHLHLLLAPL